MTDSPRAAAPRGVRRTPGRPPAVEPAAIAEAVLAVGFPALTMAAVADRLGIGQATLYRHVADRDGLVLLGLDLALQRSSWPGVEGAWQQVLRAWALRAWQVWAAYPGAVAEVSRGVVPPRLVLLADEIAAVLLRAGFLAADAVMAVDLVFDLVADHRRGVELLDGPSGPGPGRRQRLHADWLAARGPAPGVATEAERTAVRQAMSAAITADPLDWLERKLRVLIAGIEADLAASTDFAPVHERADLTQREDVLWKIAPAQ